VSEDSPRGLGDAYRTARAAHDHDTARRLPADEGFSFRSPVANFDSADALDAWASLSGGIVTGMDVRRVFAEGDEVCHILTYHYQLSEKDSIEVVHWPRVAHGRTRRIEVFFDALRERALFDPALG
jgi:hypothetical protein